MIKLLLIISVICINCFAFKTSYTFIDKKDIKVNSFIKLENGKQYFTDERFVNSIVKNYNILLKTGNCNNFKEFLNNKKESCSIEKEINSIYKEYYPEYPKEIPNGVNIYKSFYFFNTLYKKETVKILKVINVEDVKLVLFEYNRI